ncbi:SIS domain-containing protein [Lacrimispora celerecrescens]|uniref:Glutamine--fructose-6-phosphate aminotransferase [isomerizing] n=1 Tax=Lacrimispora celerecrescens TaxID=29354 RepID=A0A084JMV4_9FIRM|nr:SIS domain-containing protein [Lacrimispora celerecrescens]KEZ90288.1 hypothetical protein IO98_10060 [Lacrimispora celerecrescens]
MQEKSAMMQQIESIPALMKEIDEGLKKTAYRFTNRLGGRTYTKIILTGCGDSYCAALAAKFAFLQFTGMDAEAATVIELARVYERRHLVGNGHHMVVIVSNSGTVSRVIELAKRIRSMGGFVVAVTGNETSGLSQYADAVIKLEIPPFVYAPGVRSYCGCLCALYQMAISLGEYDGTLGSEKAGKIRAEITKLPDRMTSYLADWEIQADTYARKIKNASGYELVGSGSQYASACFGSAKSLETTGKPSIAQNTEDWFHMNFFIRDVYHMAVILIVNEAEGSVSRAEELIGVAEEMGRPLLCITDSEVLKAKEKLLTPGTQYEVLHALVQYLPAAMVFSNIGDMMGEVYFRAGKDHWAACAGGATIVNSKEIVLE